MSQQQRIQVGEHRVGRVARIQRRRDSAIIIDRTNGDHDHDPVDYVVDIEQRRRSESRRQDQSWRESDQGRSGIVKVDETTSVDLKKNRFL